MYMDSVARRWYPKERNSRILNVKSQTYRAPRKNNLATSTKVFIGVLVGLVAAAVIGGIVGGVLGTKSSSNEKGTSDTDVLKSTTMDPMTTETTDNSNTKPNITGASGGLPDNQPEATSPLVVNPLDLSENKVVDLGVELVLPGTFTADLLDKNSTAYKELAAKICDTLKNAAPADEIDDIDCSDIEFSPGSIRCRMKGKLRVKRNVPVSTNSIANNLVSLITNGLEADFPGIENITVTNEGLCNPNPCMHMGECLEAENGDFKCRCKSGRVGKTCDEELQYCLCKGDPHCTTFDKLNMDYQGTCKFLFAKSDLFKVHLRSVNRNGVTRVAWSRFVELEYSGDIIKLGKLDPYHLKKQIGAMVNGVKVDLPYKKADYEINQKGSGVECRTGLGVVVGYTLWKVRVGIPPSFKNRMEGFCGNFDGNKVNDMKTASGDQVSSANNFGNIIGDSYIVADHEQQPFSSNCKQPNDIVVPTCPGVDFEKAFDLCNKITDKNGPFQNCVEVFDPEEVAQTEKWCKEDVKMTCDVSVSEAALRTHLDECNDKDDEAVTDDMFEALANMSTGNQSAYAADTCFGGSELVQRSSGCIDTCKTTSSNESCTLPDVINVCVCPQDQVMFKGKCIEKADCGCTLENGRSLFLNEKWLSEDCSQQFTCLSPDNIQEEDHTCSVGKTCHMGKCTGCHPVNPCKNGGECEEDDLKGFNCTCQLGFSSRLCSLEAKECSCSGLGHMTSFDGLSLDYNGNRRHLVSGYDGEDGFKVFLKKSMHRGREKAGLIKFVEIELNGKLVKLQGFGRRRSSKVKAYVNFKRVGVPFMDETIKIMKKGHFTEVITDLKVVVKFSSNSYFKIMLPNDLKTKVYGMCGNYDGMKDNDKTLMDGSTASGLNPEELGEEIGDSFIEDDSLETNITVTNGTEVCPADFLVKTNKMCELLASSNGLFKDCLVELSVIQVSKLKMNCEKDVLLTCDKSFAVDALEILNDKCAHEGMPYVAWRPLVQEPCLCANPTMVCKPSAPPCIATCHDPFAVEDCKLPDVRDLCTCPDGKVLFNNLCVEALECGCMDKDGKTRNLGDKWLSEDCSKEYFCKLGGTIDHMDTNCTGQCYDGFCYKQQDQFCNSTSCTNGDCQMGQDRRKFCTCRPGFAGTNCEQRYRECSAFGAGHVLTFDALDLIYTGTCKYILAACGTSDPFRVYARNALRFGSKKTAFLRYVEIEYKQKIVRFGRKEDSSDIGAWVDNVPVTTSDGDFPHFSIYQIGNDYVFESLDSSVKLIYSASWKAKIQLINNPSTKGLCGNSNFLKDDDNSDFLGTLLSTYSPYESGKVIGDSSVFLTDPENTVQSVTECLPSVTDSNFNYPSPGPFGPSGSPESPGTPESPPPLPTFTPTSSSYPQITSDCSAPLNQAASGLCSEFTSPEGIFKVCANNETFVETGDSVGIFPDGVLYGQWCQKDFADTCNLNVVFDLISRFSKLCVDYSYTNGSIDTVTRTRTFNRTFENGTLETVTYEEEVKSEESEDREKALDFRNNLGLPSPCEENTEYVAMSFTLPQTCEPMTDFTVSPIIYDTCVCLPGYVLFGGECVSPSQCGLVVDNVAREEGDTWLWNSCATEKTLVEKENGDLEVESKPFSCRPGTACTLSNTCSGCLTNPCKNGAECAESETENFVCKCRFASSGPTCEEVEDFAGCLYFNSRVVTFDGLFLSYSASCKTTLFTSASPRVEISVFFLDGDLKKVWFETDKASFEFSDIEMKQIKIMNGNETANLPFSEDGLEVSGFLDSIKISMNKVLVVVFKKKEIDIQVADSSFKNTVEGLCGNNDDNIENDSSLKNGTLLPGIINGTLEDEAAQKLGESFLAPELLKNPECKVAQIEPPQSASCSYEDVTFSKKCEEITKDDGPFEICQGVLSDELRENFKNVCIEEFQKDCDRMKVTATLENVIDSCSSNGLLIPPSLCKTLEIGCECPFKNSMWVPKAPSCPLTCLQPDPSKIDCEKADLVDVCVCKKDFVLFKGTCVPAADCGCYDEMDKYHELGDSWLSGNCSMKYICQGANEVEEFPNDCNKTCLMGRCTACIGDKCGEGGMCMDTELDKGYFCRCKPGFVGDGFSCKKKEVGVCSGYGDPHYMTFDNQSLDYQGVGKFIFVKSLDMTREFTVFTKNYRKGKDDMITWVKYIELSFGESSIRLQKAYPFQSAPIIATLNREDGVLNIPFTSPNADYELSYEGAGVKCATNFGVTVYFKPGLGVKVELSEDYQGNVTGFCGNFDGNRDNDLIANGRDVSSLPEPGNEVGNSYVVTPEDCGIYDESVPVIPNTFFLPPPPPEENDDDENDDGPGSEDGSPNGEIPKPTFNPLDIVPDRSMCKDGEPLSPGLLTTPACSQLDMLKERCQILGDVDGLFGECLMKMDEEERERFVDLCEFDVTFMCSEKAFAESFMIFAYECDERFGVDVKPVSKVECGCVQPFTTCQKTAPSCPATCAKPNAPEICLVADAKYVCACEPGRLLFNGKCVLPSECGCVDKNGKAYMVGDSWISESCDSMLTCSAPENVVSVDFACPLNKNCSKGRCEACTSDTCGNMGQCLETEEDFECGCKLGFMGEECEIEMKKATYQNGYAETFDGTWIDYKGVGEFLFCESTKKTLFGNAQDPSKPDEKFNDFEVYIRNEFDELAEKVLYAKSTTIKFDGVEIEIGRKYDGQEPEMYCLVDGEAVDSYNGTNFELNLVDVTKIVFESKDGLLLVTYDASDSSVEVEIPESYKGVEDAVDTGIQGLCGNFDGNKENDLRTKDGTDVFDEAEAGKLIGESFTNQTDPEFIEAANIPKELLNKDCKDMELLKKCEIFGDKEGLFKAAVAEFGKKINMYKTICESSIKEKCTYAAFCEAAEYMQDDLFEIGLVTPNWRETLNCEVQCPPGQMFTNTAPGCAKTCLSEENELCAEPEQGDGCVCSMDKVLFKGKCIAKKDCGCFDEETSRAYNVGETWKTEECKKMKTCVEEGKITEKDIEGCERGACVKNLCSGCEEDPCDNGGKCTDESDFGDFSCACKYGTFGRRCKGSGNRADIGILLQDGSVNCPTADEAAYTACVEAFYVDLKAYISTFYDDLIIGPGDVRVALAVFTDEAEIKFNFDEYNSVEDLKSATNDLIFEGSKDVADITEILKTVVPVFFPPPPTSPPPTSPLPSPLVPTSKPPPADIPKWLLILAGGNELTVEEGSLEKTKEFLDKEGVLRYCGGYYEDGEDEILEELASDSDDYAPDYSLVLPEDVKKTIGVDAGNDPSPSGEVGVLQGVCSCRGDPHFTTFDGKNIDYQGTCVTVLVKGQSASGNFSIHLQSEHKNGNKQLAWARSVEIIYGGFKAKMVKLDTAPFGLIAILVDDEEVEAPYSSARLSIAQTADAFHLVTSDQLLSVSYTTSGSISIKIPNSWATKVSGLCGNFDGDADNDLTTMEGLDVSADPDADNIVGDSFVVGNDEDTEDCKAPEMLNQTCTKEAGEVRWKCHEMEWTNGTFADCVAKMDAKEVEIFVQNCLSDLDLSCNPKSIQNTIEEYASFCFQKYETEPEGWREKLELPCKCMGDMVCLPKASPCLPTIVPTPCTLPEDLDVCTCASREVFFSGRCVSMEEVGCVDENGKTREIKESWLSGDCGEMRTCMGENIVSSSDFTCPSGSFCYNGKCSGCLLEPCMNGASCIENSVCPSKTEQGCYWKKIVGVASIIGKEVEASDLSSCFLSCIEASEPSCQAFTWSQAGEDGPKCAHLSSIPKRPPPPPPLPEGPSISDSSSGSSQPPPPPPPSQPPLNPPLPPGLLKDPMSTLYAWKCTGKSGCECDKGDDCAEDEETPASYECNCKMGSIGENCDKQSGICDVSNGPMVKTFDGADLSYRAGCTIEMVSFEESDAPPFKISMKNVLKEDVDGWPRALQIQYKGKDYRLMSKGYGIPTLEEIIKDEKPKELSTNFMNDDITVQTFAKQVEFQTAEGVKIVIKSSGGALIELPPTYKDKVTGFCGNFNGDAEDDTLLPPDSPLGPSDPSVGDVGNDLGNNYFIPDDYNSQLNSCSVPDIPSNKMYDFQNDSSPSVCGLLTNPLGPFSEAIPLVTEPEVLKDLESECRSMVNQTEEGKESKGACPAFEKMSDLFTSLVGKAPDYDWRSALDCECKCDPGFECAFKAPGCLPTCQNPRAPADCPYPEVQYMCVCPQGTVFQDGMCVDRSFCGCVDEQGVSRQIEETWLSEDCRKMYTCKANGSFPEADNTCSSATKCKAGVCSACEMKNECENDAKCMDMEDGKTSCACLPGATGPLCQFDDLKMCSIIGNSHLMTFDGAAVNFAGDCKVLLAESSGSKPFFKISGKAAMVTESGFKLKSVEIDLGESVVKFEMSSVTELFSGVDTYIDGKQIELPAKLAENEIQVKKGYPVLLTPFGMVVSFHDSMLYVIVPSHFGNSLEGMCGNANGIVADDYKLKGEAMLSGTDTVGDSVDFGRKLAESFLVDNQDTPNPSCIPLDRRPPPLKTYPSPQDNDTTSSIPTTAATTQSPPTTSSPGALPDIPPSCKLSEEEIANHTKVCTEILNVDGIFGKCLKAANGTKAIELIKEKVAFCQQDIVNLCDPSVVVVTLSVVAGMCQTDETSANKPEDGSLVKPEDGFSIGPEGGYKIWPEEEIPANGTEDGSSDWPEMLEKPPTCGVEGMEFVEEMTTTCTETCGDPDASETCATPDAKNFCSCPPTHVLDSSKCIPRSKCGCVSDAGSSIQVGGIWFEKGCSVKNVCRGPSRIEREENEGGYCDSKCPCCVQNA